MKELVIITGAGASHGVANPYRISVRDKFTPPLTTDLFRSGRDQPDSYVKECLKKNPYAAQVGKDWKEGKQPLEEYLSELKSSHSLMLRRQYWAIPIYLYELFSGISINYIESTTPGIPSNYKSLINAIAKNGDYAQIIWINLNYDTLADMAIKESTSNPLNTLGDYMSLETPDKMRIKYTKPHGSVDWYRQGRVEINWDSISVGRVPDDFENLLSKRIYTEHQAREAKLNKRLQLYPAISAPLGKYEYVYPEHMDVIIPELKKSKATSLLCIGFSALDEDILKLIKDNISAVTKLKIVNGDFNIGKDTFLRISRYCGNVKMSQEEAISKGGFTEFLLTEADEWLSQ